MISSRILTGYTLKGIVSKYDFNKAFESKVLGLRGWPDRGNLGLEARRPRTIILVRDFKATLYVWGGWPHCGNLDLEARSFRSSS